MTPGARDVLTPASYGDQDRGPPREAAFGGYDPAWSPRGDLVAFARDDGIFTVRPDGSGLMRLTTQDPATSTGDRAPDWSPDGRRLAFERGGSACSLRVWTMDADGGNARQAPIEACHVVAPV